MSEYVKTKSSYALCMNSQANACKKARQRVCYDAVEESAARQKPIGGLKSLRHQISACATSLRSPSRDLDKHRSHDLTHMFTRSTLVVTQIKYKTVSYLSMAIRPISSKAAEQAAASIHQPRDPNTLSNYNAWRIQHTIASFDIDFKQQKLSGHVQHSIKKLANDPKIVLDSR